MAKQKQDPLREAQENSPVQFFGEVDLNPRGGVGSAYPGWMFPRLIEEMEEQILYEESQLKDQLLDASQKASIRESIDKKRERLQKIEDGRPKLDKDEVAGIRGSIGEKIKESLFTYDQMQKGTADAHKELARMKDPCIKLDGKELEYALGARVAISEDKKVSRDSAAKIYKMCSAYLGEDSNIESLRR